MIKRELARNPELKNENWSRFLPQFKSSNKGPKKKPKKVKKEYTPFPPPPQERKIDKLLESGEYFMTEQDKQKKKQQEIEKKRAEAKVRREDKRARAFVPPKESQPGQTKPIKKKNKNSDEANIGIDLDALRSKVKKLNKNV